MLPYFNTGPKKTSTNVIKLKFWHKKHSSQQTTNGQLFMGSYQFSGFFPPVNHHKQDVNLGSGPRRAICMCSWSNTSLWLNDAASQTWGRFLSNKLQNEFNYLSLNLKTICQSEKYQFVCLLGFLIFIFISIESRF